MFQCFNVEFKLISFLLSGTYLLSEELSAPGSGLSAPQPPTHHPSSPSHQRTNTSPWPAEEPPEGGRADRKPPPPPDSESGAPTRTPTVRCSPTGSRRTGAGSCGTVMPPGGSTPAPGEQTEFRTHHSGETAVK